MLYPSSTTSLKLNHLATLYIYIFNYNYIYIYIYLVKIAVGWSKNICNLIIAVGFNFCANLIVRSSLNC